MKYKGWIKYFIIGFLAINFSCTKSASTSGGNGNGNPTNPGNTIPGINFWLTTGDKNYLLTKQTTAAGFSSATSINSVISVDSSVQYQQVDGFGYTLTQGSALVISQLPSAQKDALLNELFGTQDNSIHVSYLRVGIGATDLSTSVYTYDDLPAGQVDPLLSNFSLQPDQAYVIPLLKQILLINPGLKILATPWTAPSWMKDNGNSVGGSLLPVYYSAYANYFVRYIQAMQAEGIHIDAVTPQNEPLHPGNNPSMYMTAAQQTNFIKNNLGPAFAAASVNTKIIIYDHNCDRPDYPLEILGDAQARNFIDGSTFHLYAGSITALLQVHTAYPGKNIYFTEQYTASTGSFSGDLQWHLKYVIIGSMRNYSKIALEWNLANDPAFNPHTPGGCNTCLGALTIGSGAVTRNVAYYIIAHASKFVTPGSIRISSDNYGNLSSAAFLRTDGKKVLIVLNEDSSTQNFHIKYNAMYLATTLQEGAVATYMW